MTRRLACGYLMTLYFVHPCILQSATAASDVADAARYVRQIVAHRGSSADRPENTIAAYQRAIDAGATAIEVDVRTSRDGRLVTLHDATVDRTTDGTGGVNMMTLEELRRLDAGTWFDAAYADQRIPTLREILALAGDKIDVLLDLKESGRPYAQAVAEEIRQHGQAERIIVGVRSTEQAGLFRELLPTARQLGLIGQPDEIDAFADAGVETIRLWPRWLHDDSAVARIRSRNCKLHLNGTNGTWEDVLPLLAHRPDSLSSDDPGKLRETLADVAAVVRRIQPGDIYRVTVKSTLDGYLDLPKPNETGQKRLPINGTAQLSYRERALAADSDGTIQKTLRIYDSLDCRRTMGDQPQMSSLRDEVRRIVLHCEGNIEKPYSPDGPLMWSEIDLLATHVFLPSLAGFLPDGRLVKGAQWEATPLAVAELVGLEQIASGSLSCVYNGVVQFEEASLGQIAFSGTVTGRPREGAFHEFASRNVVRGAVYLDPLSWRVRSMRATGILELLGPNDRMVGKLDVDWQMIIRPIADDPELGAEVAKQIPEKPDEKLTDLAYEHPGLGLRVIHPRRWILATVTGSQALLQFEQNSMVINVEPPGRTPTAAAYREEVVRYLPSAGISVSAGGKLREANSAAGRIANFRFHATLNDRPVTLDYWVVERGDRGATIAATFERAQAKRLAADSERVTRGLTFFAPLAPIAPPARLQTPKPTPKR